MKIYSFYYSFGDYALSYDGNEFRMIQLSFNKLTSTLLLNFEE